jgi:hypothetical protein
MVAPGIGLGESLIVGGAALLVCGTPLLALGLAVLFGLKRRRPF